MKKEEPRRRKTLWIVLMLVLSITSIAASAYFYGKSIRDIFMLVLVAAACFGTVVFSLVQSEIFGTLHYDNGSHYARFAATFIVSAFVSCLLPSLRDEAWAVPSFAIALSLFSNTVTGITAYAGLLGVCAYLASGELLVFIIYFIMGVIFAVLFEKLDEDYKTGAPMFAAMLLYAAALGARLLLENRGAVDEDALVLAAINIFVTFIIMLAVLRFYCATAIDKEKGKYLAINDQEYKLLAKYKEEDSSIYYNAIHTAYFAEKTARLLHMDVDVAKNGGYYHKIIALECQKREKTLEEICAENKFPPKAVQLLQEYNYKSQPIRMRETVAVYIADSVVSAIMYLIGKDKASQDKPDAPRPSTDYAKVAVGVLHRKIDSGALNDSDISLADIKQLEKIYTGEKLYYDFLYRE